MSLINKEIADFSVQAFQNAAFRTVTKEDVLGKWSVFFFYPADFTFVCPTELEDLAKPVICAINGYALGGGLELALCCDIRLCSETAKFGQPEVGLGITPGFGGTQRLPRVVGTSNAMTLTLTGKPVGAEDALRMRLVNRVYPDAELMDGAMEMAETIANNAPLAVHYCKVAMSRRVDRFLENDLDYEAQVFGECFETEDQLNAMTAFLAKRPKAEFKGE